MRAEDIMAGDEGLVTGVGGALAVCFRTWSDERLLPRWIFLRALGLIYYSAFFSLVFQIKGLIGPQGILPAGEYLHAVTRQFGRVGYWYAPTLLWLSSGRHLLTAICWVGM